MKKNIKIIILAIIFIIVGVIVVCTTTKKDKTEDKNKLRIVTTSFSSYDFVKHIVGDKADVTFLLGPGIDAHSYEPTANDLAVIQNCDIFIYIGGEMEKWTEKILGTDVISEKTKLVKVTESVDTIEEQEVDGAEEEKEEEEEGAFDEHIWTSPTNSIKMMKYLNDTISNIDPENENFYKNNTDEYIAQIENLRAEIQDIVDNKKRDSLVFGDKMPIQYFLNEFNLKASAAFSGCSTETEPSTKTIAYLVNKVKEENIPVVLYIELSTGKTAKTIAQETGATAMQIQTLHNVSKDDFNNGETYVSLMKRNLEVLKKALQ